MPDDSLTRNTWRPIPKCEDGVSRFNQSGPVRVIKQTPGPMFVRRMGGLKLIHLNPPIGRRHGKGIALFPKDQPVFIG